MYGGRSYGSSHHHHHHYPNHQHKGAPAQTGAVLSPESALATDIFEQFISASTFKSVVHHYRHMCDVLRLRPQNFRHFYPKLKNKIRSWKSQALWTKFDKRASHKCYNHGKACVNTKVLIIGAGPCGLRSAIEAQLLGAKVVVVEKRDRFSRNNVLHLWPFVIADLKALGAKKFYGKFCAGAIDHISIRQLQCMLLKVALLLGVEVYEGVTFEELLEPPEDQSQMIGWHARFSPLEHPVNQYEFDVLIGADGKRNTLMGFKRKEFRGKLAIAITANFINKHTEQEARVQEISGVAFIFNQKFFKDLYAETGIDLENIVYYKDETHYFVMTAKKHSLIDKGVILRDLPDTQQLLHPNNVDRKALCDYAREAADFSTGYQMPHLDFAVNHYGKPDIAMFDFTSMFAAENACRVVEKRGHKLLQCLVGDSLLEPFWPTGSGCARGFLSSFDACWAVKSWASTKMSPLEVVAERESIYRLLAQTTPENLSKDYSSYTLEPSSRYPTVNMKVLLAFQVRHLYLTDELEKTDGAFPDDEAEQLDSEDIPRKRKRRDSLIQPDTLLAWCQKQVAHNKDLKVENLSSSFKDGRVLCTILHRYRPDLVDLEHLDPSDHGRNAQLAFDLLEREFGIAPVLTGTDLAATQAEEPPSLIGYISQIHDALRGEIPHSMGARPPLKVLKGQSLEELDLGDFPDWPKDKEMEKEFFENNLSSSTSLSSIQTNGKLSCRLLEEPKPESVSMEDLQKTKKRRNEFGSLDANAYERRLNLERNREDRLRKLKEQRELDTVRFVRSMRMLHCDVRDVSLKPKSPSFRHQEDAGIAEYRKNAKSMREKARDLERKLYFPDKMERDYSNHPAGPKQRGLSDPVENFSDRVKGLEAKFRGSPGMANHHKPKDLIRAVGRLEKTDWNLSAIERKIEENPRPVSGNGDKERVPKWSKDSYKDKFQNIERRLRENGEDEERIAKYVDIDASLKRLERKLREGSTLETGLRGHNKVSDLANQLSSKLVRKEDDGAIKAITDPKQTRAMVLPTSSSDLCYFCGTRVYLVEKLNAEGKFFHRQCFKCCYCGALLRLGNYIYDRENRYGGKFFCIPHFGLTVRSRGPRRADDTQEQKTLQQRALPGNIFTKDDASFGIHPLAGVESSGSGRDAAIRGENKGSPHLLSPSSKGSSPLDRGTTPERVEFENSVIEHSDEEEYLSEDEWTDRNFGASANELDDTDDDDSDYSDLSDEEVDDEALLETSQKLTVDETRRLAESWKRRYTNDILDMSDEEQESFSDSENEDLSEHGAEGDESHTPTEDEVGDDVDDDDEDGDSVRRARELRRMEVNINVGAPPRKAETSDSGSETEIGSEEESDTQIDTDSEFADDREASRLPKEIPTIVIDEMPKEVKETEELDRNAGGDSNSKTLKESEEVPRKASAQVVPSQYVAQKIEMGDEKERAERSASLSNIPRQSPNAPNPHSEQLKRLLQRTESSEVVSAQKNYLRRQYLLGNTSNAPRKSVSSADLGNKFQSFMEKISEKQKMLNPAPQPSPAMQAFLNMSNKSITSTPPFSPLSPSKTASILNDSKPVSPSPILCLDDRERFKKVDQNLVKSEESSDSSSKSEEGRLITFPPKINVDNDSLKKDSSSPASEYDNLRGYNDDVASHSLSLDAREKGEKGALDSEQSEKGILETNLEKAIGIELRGDTESVTLIEAFNTPCVDESPDPVKALNVELTNDETTKDASLELTLGEKDIEKEEEKENENLDEIFDRLANDALTELDQSKMSDLDVLEAFNDRGKKDEGEEAKTKDTNSIQTLSSPLNVQIDKSEEAETRDTNSIQTLNSPMNLQIGISEEAETRDTNSIQTLNSPLNLQIDKSEEAETRDTNSIQTLNSSLNLQIDKSEEAETRDTNSIQTLNSPLNLQIDKNLIHSDKRQDESGFKSLEDNKLSSEFNLEFPKNEGKEEEENYILILNQSNVTTPEVEAVTTEADLSDWADDNETFAINVEDFESEFRSGQTKDGQVKAYSSAVEANVTPSIARIASLESLGDSDSAISISMGKAPSKPKDSPFGELETMDFMDISGSDSSADVPSVSIRYNQLQDCTPTSLSPPLNEPALVSDHPSQLSDRVEDAKRDLAALKGNLKSKSLDAEETLNQVVPARSSSEPPSLNESTTTSSQNSPANEVLPDSPLSITPSPGTYEGYISRFKDRKTPLRLARDSIDVRKNSSSKPLFTPSKEDELQRERNESKRMLILDCPPNSSLEDSSQSAPAASRTSLTGRSSRLAKDGDLVKEMVMSRIPKNDKGRRGSRNALHLSLHSSSSSLFGSEPSLNASSVKSFSPEKETAIITPSTRVVKSPEHSPDVVPTCVVSNVPSEEGNLEESSSDISSNKLSFSLNKMAVSSPISKKPDYSPRSILPATPLTHPEKFQREEPARRELFKSSPQLLFSTTSQPSYTSLVFSTPRKQSSELLPLSNQNTGLSKSLMNSPAFPVHAADRRLSESEVRRGNALDVVTKDRMPVEGSRKDPDERLKELLEERRRRDGGEHREVRLRNKNSCLQECLEEYRQKRSSAPVFTHSASPSPAIEFKGQIENTQTRAQLGLTKRHFHRPSLLELESMQIFSSPSREGPEGTSSSEANSSLAHTSNSSVSYSPLNSVAAAGAPYPLPIGDSLKPPLSPTKTSAEAPEKRPVKKSKDRERRRSLIQVVAGMFSKSDEKKKGDTETESKSPTVESPISPKMPPKSPSVKDRFSKLRLSRTKEKKKSPSDGKNRSASMDTHTASSSERTDLPNPLSLPTSPSRTIFSFLSSASPSRSSDRSKTSTSGSSTSYFGQRFSPSCIKEENNSEDESAQVVVAPPPKGSPTMVSTPSMRRQKAVLRAAKQAEQKRLRMAQEIQRQLEECEVKMRELEERGIGVEKALIGETVGTTPDETQLMKDWFSLVHEKNALVRWQEELTVKARELELEDRHVRLENELRQRMISAEREKTREDIEREGKILAEIISIIEQKDALVNLLEEDRQRYIEEDRDLESLHARKVLQCPAFERETGV